MTTRRKFILTTGGAAACAVISARSSFPQIKSAQEYNVLDFGAVGDGTALDHTAIQRAIDTAAAHGGGRVILPGGKRFLIGPLLLKSRVDLHLADDTLLLASPSPATTALSPA